MNWDWAKERLKAGKKVRRARWRSGHKLWLQDNGLVNTSDINICSDTFLTWDMADDWEEFVEQPKTMGFRQAIIEARGEKIKRSGWSKDSFVNCTKENGIILGERDVDATDWVVVDG